MSLTKLTGREKFNYSRPGRVWLLTSRLGMGKSLTFFYSVPNLTVHYGYCVRHYRKPKMDAKIVAATILKFVKVYILELKFCNYQQVYVIKLLKYLHITHITSDFRPLFHTRVFGNVVWLGTFLLDISFTVKQYWKNKFCLSPFKIDIKKIRLGNLAEMRKHSIFYSSRTTKHIRPI